MISSSTNNNPPVWQRFRLLQRSSSNPLPASSPFAFFSSLWNDDDASSAGYRRVLHATRHQFQSTAAPISTSPYFPSSPRLRQNLLLCFAFGLAYAIPPFFFGSQSIRNAEHLLLEEANATLTELEQEFAVDPAVAAASVQSTARLLCAIGIGLEGFIWVTDTPEKPILEKEPVGWFLQ